MNTKRLMMFLAASAVLFSSLAVAQVQLDLATTYSGTNVFAASARDFAERVAEATNGEVQIVVHEGGALGLKDEDQFSAVADGIVPLSNILMGASIGSAPIFGLSTMPFYVRGFDESKLLLDIARPYYEAAAARFNQKILYTHPWSPSALQTQRPVREYSDIKGLNIRTYDRNGTLVLNKAGANAVVMSWGDVYPALATGTIDSVLTSAQSGATGKLYEVLDYYTRVNFAIPLNMTNINLDSWNALTEEQRSAIEEVSREMETKEWAGAVTQMESDEAVLKENGMELILEISDDFSSALAADGQEIIDEWVAQTGPDAKAILEEFEAQR